MRWKPRPYMKAGVRLMVKQAEAGLLLDPGMGKTSITLAAFKLLQERKAVKSMLVIAPLNAARLSWPDEIEKWDDFKHFRYEIIHGVHRHRVFDMKGVDIYLMNPEGLPILERKVLREGWKVPEMLVLDEATRFKHTNNQRFKVMKPLLPKFKRRYILTGSPAPNRLMDLFGQIYCLDLGDALGKYITHYRRRFFYPSGYGGYTWELQEGADEEIYKAIAPLVLRLDAEDHLDMPELNEINLRVAMPERAREAYEGLEQDFVRKLRTGEVTAFNVGALTTKLRQMANGLIYLDDFEGQRPEGYIGTWQRKVETVHKAKITALHNLVEELQGQPILVIYAFQHEKEELKRRLKAPALEGSDRQRRKLIDQWNAGELPALIMYPQLGLNLQKGGHHMAFFGLTWDLEAYDQTVRRLWRQGQTKPVTIHRIVTHESIDETILNALRSKRKTQNALLNALKKEYL